MQIKTNCPQDAEKLAATNSIEKKAVPAGFLDFVGLLLAVPLGERTLRTEIKKGHIPAIKMPGGRRLLFHWPSVEKALIRYQKGGISE